jgi:hypothetical protein
VLNLHALRVKLLQEVAVLYWRLYCVIRSSPLADTPTSVRPLLAGTVAELHIEKVFPCTKCFVLCELETFAIRWTPFHFVSLYTVDNVQKRHTGIETSAPKRHRSTLPGADRCSSFCQLSGASSQRPSGATAEEPPLQCQANVGAAAATPCDSASQPDRKSHRGSRRNSKDSAAVKKTFDILITFRDGGGYTRVLVLCMPTVKVAATWLDGVQALLAHPRIASAAHWHWALSCMASTSRRGASGFLQRSELRPLLRCANANATLSAVALETAFAQAVESRERMNFPPWQRVPSSHRGQPLCAQQITWFLVQLSTCTKEITAIFDEYAPEGRMNLEQWLRFCGAEQSALHSDGADEDLLLQREALHNQEAELLNAQRQFENAIAAGCNECLILVQFALQLLSVQNDAVASKRTTDLDQLREPFAHYWTACSHNSLGHLGSNPIPHGVWIPLSLWFDPLSVWSRSPMAGILWATSLLDSARPTRIAASYYKVFLPLSLHSRGSLRAFTRIF